VLRLRQLIPPLTIRASTGRLARAWDFKQKKNLVILFLDAACDPCEQFLRELAAHAASLRDAEAVALVAFLEPPPGSLEESLPPEIIAGADVSGRSARAFLGEAAASPRSRLGRGVFVTDRYGELAAQWIAAQHEFPSVAEIFSTLDRVQIACDECFMPHWPAEEPGE